MGSLIGLISKLDYFADLGIDTVLITPNYPAPNMQYAGYDVTDYIGINPRFGTMRDFEDLIGEMNRRGKKPLS